VTAPRNAGGELLEPGRALSHEFHVAAPGEAWVALTLFAPGTSWERGDAAVVALEMDGETQHLVVAADEPVAYARILGRLEAGPHRLSLHLDTSLSAASARAVECRAIEVRAVADGDGAAFVWRHAPVLHYRTLDSPLDGAFTDTPLLLFYRPVETSEGRGIEYHVINSHEDAGTDLAHLLACWGHTTDIEWIFRVVRDRRGRIVREEFQGPEHATLPFRGARALGGHPVLQAATRNGMVTDRATSPYRAALAPVAAQPPGEPREGVQYRFPWIHRVSALEVARHEAARAAGEPLAPGGAAPVDPRAYVYVQCKRDADAAVPALEALIRISGAWHGSAGGRPEFAMQGDDAECTAIRLPAGARDTDVEAIAIRAIDQPPRDAMVRFVRAFCLDERGRPQAPFAAAAAGTLSAAAPEATVWRRTR